MRKMKLQDYADHKGLTYRTVWNWCKGGKLNTETDATGHIFVLVEDLEEETLEDILTQFEAKSNEFLKKIRLMIEKKGGE